MHRRKPAAHPPLLSRLIEVVNDQLRGPLAVVLGSPRPVAELLGLARVLSCGQVDPERGFRLTTYAIWWIRASIHEFILRNWRIVKVATTKAQRKLFFNLRSLKQGLGTLGADGLFSQQRRWHVRGPYQGCRVGQTDGWVVLRANRLQQRWPSGYFHPSGFLATASSGPAIESATKQW